MKGEEGRLVQQLKEWFESRGYKTITECVDDPQDVADIDQCRRGRAPAGRSSIDLVAQSKSNPAEKWIVQAKGPAGRGYAVYQFCYALGELLRAITRDPEEYRDIKYALAIPWPDRYSAIVGEFGTRCFIPVLKLRLHLLLLADSDVTLMSPEDWARVEL